MKKAFVFFLCAAMLLSVLSACADKGGDSAETTSSPVVSTAGNTDETTAEPPLTIAVENLSSNGKPLAFNMLVRTNRYAYLFCEEPSGDLIDYAVYKRNSMIEDLYGIKISISESGDAAGFSTYMNAASTDYDICVPDYWWNLDLQGFFTDILSLPEIDTSDAWWYDGWNKNVTINGKMYTVAGDASLEMLENLEVMFFNKNMAKDKNIDIYKYASDGQWTVDKCLEVINTASSGLDDSDTNNDVYGALYDVHSLDAQLYSCGLRLSEVGESEIGIDIANSQKTVDIAEAVTKLIGAVGTDYSSKTARARDWSLFKNGNALIYATALYLGKSLKSGNLDFDYGIVPMPKLAEEDQYISTSYGVSVFAIPVSVASTHNSALILNALNFNSANTDDSVVTTFFDVILKYQVANSPEDIENLDLVRKNVYIDFAFIYDVGLDSAIKNAVIDKTSASVALKAAVKTAGSKIKNNIIAAYEK
ncbi:MAG: hypothetical protein MJ137_08640 [Clostridia bacterium]|nr:hypothetical protein [Clostridia bacterium]